MSWKASLFFFFFFFLLLLLLLLLLLSLLLLLLTAGRPDLEGLVSAGRQQPVAICVPQSLHHRVAVPMQRGNVAPSLGIPHLHQAILAATGQHSFRGVPVAAFDVTAVTGHCDL